MGTVRKTLLKTSMPVVLPGQVAQQKSAAIAKRRRSVRSAALLRVNQNRAMQRMPLPRVQGWVVLTSWEDSSQQRMMLTVAGERVFSSSFAAVPTEGGWLVIQL